MSCQLVESWTPIFRGYTQAEGSHTGSERLYSNIRARHSGPTHEVILKSWRDDVDGLADRIFNHSAPDPWITIIGYSYGGFTAVQLAWALAARGLKVGWLCLIDAVYRSRFVLLRWVSLLPFMRIKVPDTVQNFIGWYQRTNLPAGHQVVLPKKTKNFGFMEIESVKHAWMDDHPGIHRRIMDIAAE